MNALVSIVIKRNECLTTTHYIKSGVTSGCGVTVGRATCLPGLASSSYEISIGIERSDPWIAFSAEEGESQIDSARHYYERILRFNEG